MSAEFVVYFTQTASSNGIKVTAEDSEEAIDKAYEELPGSLCHRCAREIDLAGEWEPVSVTDADGEEVWTA